MFPRANRLDLRAHPEFFRQCRRHTGTYVEILTLPSPQEIPQLAAVVSKQVAPKATQRNHIKRQLRAALLTEVNNLAKLWVVIRPRYRITQATYEQIHTEVHQLVANLSH